MRRHLPDEFSRDVNLGRRLEGFEPAGHWRRTALVVGLLMTLPPFLGVVGSRMQGDMEAFLLLLGLSALLFPSGMTLLWIWHRWPQGAAVYEQGLALLDGRGLVVVRWDNIEEILAINRRGVDEALRYIVHTRSGQRIVLDNKLTNIQAFEQYVQHGRRKLIESGCVSAVESVQLIPLTVASDTDASAASPVDQSALSRPS